MNRAPTTELAAQLTPQRIDQTAARLSGLVRRTPTITVDRSDFGLPAGPLILKLEHLQHTGSFKVRGAFANLLLRTTPAVGVVAASGGNHGAAVAFAAQRLGMPARIYVPHTSSPTKVARIRGYGADLVLHGQTYADTAQVIGVEPRTAPTLSEALRAGHPVDAPTGGIAVDSLAPRRIGENTFAVLTAHRAQAILVRDDEIRHAQHPTRQHRPQSVDPVPLVVSPPAARACVAAVPHPARGPTAVRPRGRTCGWLHRLAAGLLRSWACGFWGECTVRPG